VRILFTPRAWDDYLSWQVGDRKTLRRINALIADVARGAGDDDGGGEGGASGTGGIGKPEALRHDLAGFWSRRIDQEHRLVYRVRDGAIEIVACRYHYEA
jgi:toxin YoeB